MTDITQYEPLWGSWHVETLIGEGSFGRVYKVRKEEFGKTYYAAVKIISIPQNEADLRQMRGEGMTDASVRSYYQAFVADIIQEIDLMSELRGNSNVVSFEDHKVIERADGFGWDILIRMELLTSLTEKCMEKPLPPEEVVKLGIHICRALELCAELNTIHRDIKPDNIFVSKRGDYKLGDFGIARQVERTMSGLSKKGTYTYMAPEVFTGQDYGASVDTYSLGIVMYRLLNKNRTPFLPPFPKPILPNDRDASLQRRMRGEAIPAIAGVDPALNDIILKACAFDRKGRFATAADMRQAIEAYIARAPILSAAPLQAPEPMPEPEPATEATVGAFDSVVPERTAVTVGTFEKLLAPEKLITSAFSSDAIKGSESADIRVLIAQGRKRNLPFGKYTWRVLDNCGFQVLLITEDVVEKRAFDAVYNNTTWENCTLRQYLNHEFYETLSKSEQAMVVETQNDSEMNRLRRNTTTDKIFLLSAEEVTKYFACTELLKERMRKGRAWITDVFDNERLAEYGGQACWWWLRSASIISAEGSFIFWGISLVTEEGGIRPAIWLKLQ